MISRIIEFSIRRRWLVVLACACRVRSRRVVARAHPDRCGAGHHQQPGADQHRRAGALAGRDRKAGHLSASKPRWPALPALNTPARFRATASRRSRRCSATRPTSISRASRSTSACSKSAAAFRPAPSRRMGPVSTGLGEIYMWTVEYRPPDRRRGEGRTAGLAERRRLSHAGRAALDQRPRARRLSAHGPGLDHPAAAQRRAGRGRRRCDRRLRQAVPGAARPGEADRAWAFVRRHRPRD